MRNSSIWACRFVEASRYRAYHNVHQNENDLPTLSKPAVSSFDELGALAVPDPTCDGRMPVMLEAIRAVRSAVGTRVAIRSPGAGPFALASYLMGTERWLYEVAMAEAGMPQADEPGLHAALQLATDALATVDQRHL